MKKVTTISAVLLIGSLAAYLFYPEPELPADTVIDDIIVDKSDRTLSVFSKGSKIKSYKISLGGNPTGHKQFEGDKRTPEGKYSINTKNAESGYHKNLGISYPNEADRERAKQLGKPVGGDIKIHGLRNGLGFIGKCQRFFDWTNGCIALTDKEIDELYSAVPIGTKIEINP